MGNNQIEDEEKNDDARERRRQRRIRSQVTAYIILLVILLALAGAIVYGVKMLGPTLTKAINSATAVSSEDESATETTEAVIETPEITDDATQEESVAEVMTQEDMLDEIVDSCISEMSLEDKVSSLFVVTPEQLTGVSTAVKAGSGTQKALADAAVGGIVYSSKNVKSESQITEMLDATSKMSMYPLFMMVSEEKITGLTAGSQTGVSDIPDAQDADSAYSQANIIGNYLATYGFNVNMAPTINLSDDAEDSYGSDASAVSQVITAYQNGLKDSTVNSCLRSFPVDADTKNGLVTVDKSKEDLQAGEFKVFGDAIANGAQIIMVSNASVPALTGDNTPASLSSSVITDVLRGELGFEGVVITDEMAESAIVDYYTPDQSAVMALTAGADMIYVPENFETARQGVIDAVNNGQLTEDRIDESLRRIYRIKYADKVNAISADQENSADQEISADQEASVEEEASVESSN